MPGDSKGFPLITVTFIVNVFASFIRMQGSELFYTAF